MVKKDMMTQKELFQQRLAERKKTRQPRSNSVAAYGGMDSTLPLEKLDSLENEEVSELKKTES